MTAGPGRTSVVATALGASLWVTAATATSVGDVPIQLCLAATPPAIVSALASDGSEMRQRLRTAGIARIGSGDLSFVFERPPLRIPGARLGEAIREERDRSA